LGNIDNIENRIRQIEMKIDRGPSINSSAFHELMEGQAKAEAPETKFGAQPNVAMNKLNFMSMNGLHFNPNIRPSGASPVQPLAQSNGISCGQTSVAMCINSLTGQSLTDVDVDQKYGFGLLNALKSESAKAGYDWSDKGNLTADSWATIDRKVNQEKLPVVVALNGPEFSPSGRGHIVTIVKTEGDTVTFADPATGTLRTTTKQSMQNAPSHPDGNFVFVADRLNAAPPSAPPMPIASLDPNGGSDDMSL
jgi:hypothetical protein